MRRLEGRLGAENRHPTFHLLKIRRPRTEGLPKGEDPQAVVTGCLAMAIRARTVLVVWLAASVVSACSPVRSRSVPSSPAPSTVQPPPTPPATPPSAGAGATSAGASSPCLPHAVTGSAVMATPG